MVQRTSNLVTMDRKITQVVWVRERLEDRVNILDYTKKQLFCGSLKSCVIHVVLLVKNGRTIKKYTVIFVNLFTFLERNLTIN